MSSCPHPPTAGQFTNHHTVTPTHRCCSLKVLIGWKSASNRLLQACLRHKLPTRLRVTVFTRKIRSMANNLSCLATSLSSSHTAGRKAARSTTHQVGKVGGFTNASPFNVGWEPRGLPRLYNNNVHGETPTVARRRHRWWGLGESLEHKHRLANGGREPRQCACIDRPERARSEAKAHAQTSTSSMARDSQAAGAREAGVHHPGDFFFFFFFGCLLPPRAQSTRR